MIQDYFERITHNSRPHVAFKLDWTSYDTENFARAFLPYSHELREANFYIYDAAELFTATRPKNQYKLQIFDGKKVPNIVVYTYAKGTQAALNKKRLRVRADEIASFMEVDKTGKINMSVKLGSAFKSYLRKNAEKTGLKTDPAFLEQQNYALTKSEMATVFGNGAEHGDMINFLFKKTGLERTTLLKESGDRAFKAAFERIRKNVPEVRDTVYFDAGSKKKEYKNGWAHGDITYKALSDARYNYKEINQVYMGNWLRDMSSLIDTSVIGFKADDVATLKRESIFASSDAVKNKLSLFWFFTQKGMVKLLYYYSVRAFIAKPAKEKSPHFPERNFTKHIEAFNKEYGELTVDDIGVYRPEEHIDNPKGLPDASIFGNELLNDPIVSKINFHSPYGQTSEVIQTLYPGETEESLKVWEGDMLKNYIKYKIEDRPSSMDFISQQLQLADTLGRSKEGLRYLGAALHTLEDYYAHSNFVELLLIKNGQLGIFPWVELSAEVKKIKDGPQKARQIPIVTGTFGTYDAIASGLPKLLNLIRPDEKEYKDIGAGERTFFDYGFIAVFEDIVEREKGLPKDKKLNIRGYGMEELLKLFKTYLAIRDAWEIYKARNPIFEVIDVMEFYLALAIEMFSYVEKTINDWLTNLALDESSMAGNVAVSRHQLNKNMNFGTDPSHTQLAKDSPLHPLNPLAGMLAVYAVQDVANMMIDCWNRKITVDKVINKINSTYLVHPVIVEHKAMDDLAKEWIRINNLLLKTFKFFLKEPRQHEHFKPKQNQQQPEKKKLDYLRDFTVPPEVAPYLKF